MPPPPPAEEPVRVQYRNPFDAREVFEFPPGTTRIEARDAVAQLLLERARDRLSPPPKVKRETTKTAGDELPATAAGVAQRR
jgi:hypothetical protein